MYSRTAAAAAASTVTNANPRVAPVLGVTGKRTAPTAHTAANAPWTSAAVAPRCRLRT